MTNAPDPERLKAFEDRLDAARAAQEPEGIKHRGHTDAGMAWRMVIELVTGIGVGFGLGYGIDWVFGTLPVFLMIFTLLGFAAGVRVMLETAKEAQRTADERKADDG